MTSRLVHYNLILFIHKRDCQCPFEITIHESDLGLGILLVMIKLQFPRCLTSLLQYVQYVDERCHALGGNFLISACKWIYNW